LVARIRRLVFCSRHNIYNFFFAYTKVSSIFKDSDVDPKPIQKIIYDYVIANKINLARIFHVAMPKQFKYQDIQNITEINGAIMMTFDNISISESDIQVFKAKVKKAKMVSKTKYENDIRLRARLIQIITLLFGLEYETCVIKSIPTYDLDTDSKSTDETYNRKKGSYRILSMPPVDETEYNLEFKNTSAEQVSKYSDQLKNLGLDVEFVSKFSFFRADYVLYIKLPYSLADAVNILSKNIKINQ
jgi:hypothetical protein